jgi:hypothetical protein
MVSRKDMSKDEKEARLAAALRENLRKRKAAAKPVVPAQAGTSGGTEQGD